MLLLRCQACGHGTPHREGVRFCASCAAPLGLAGCPACSRDVFAGDRHCACCGQALGVAGLAPLPAPLPSNAWAPSPPAAAAPKAAPAPPGKLNESLLADLHHLVDEARARAREVDDQPPSMGNKAHLDQADIDRLFGIDG